VDTVVQGRGHLVDAAEVELVAQEIMEPSDRCRSSLTAPAGDIGERSLLQPLMALPNGIPPRCSIQPVGTDIGVQLPGRSGSNCRKPLLAAHMCAYCTIDWKPCDHRFWSYTHFVVDDLVRSSCWFNANPALG